MRRRVAGLAVLLLAACGDDPSTSAARDQAPLEELADELVATCGGIEFDSVPADPSAFAPADEVWDEIDLAGIGMEGEFFDGYDWSIERRTEQELRLFGTSKEPVTEGPPYAGASFERGSAGWRPTSWGQCRIELSSPGYGPARFVLDPDREPVPEATSIHVLATEMACASGTSPDGRDVQSVVLAEDDESVSIVVLVEPPSGDQTCPGNPPIPLEVELGSPLGDRTVLDAGVQPPLARPWPPTESSLGSMGLEG